MSLEPMTQDDGWPEMSWSESGKPLHAPLAARTDKIDVEQALVLKRAVEAFGCSFQMRKVAEELRELADECDRAANGVGNADALALERADVEIVLYQFDNLLLPSLRPAVRGKIKSQIDRLERRMKG